MSKNLNGNYALANYINATIKRMWNGGAGFVPIGNQINPFNGTFDGRGYKIMDMYIESSAEFVGLFGYTTNKSEILNVSLVNFTVIAKKCCSLAGELIGLSNGMLSYSYAIGKVCGDWAAGGMVGWNSATISDSYSTGNVSASGLGAKLGGLVGGNDNGTVTASFWDMNTSRINHSAGCTGLTTEAMMNESTFLSAGWNFNNVWGIWNGKTYPFLRWQGMKSISSAPAYLHVSTGNKYVNLTWKVPANKDGLAITGYKIYKNGAYLTMVPATQLWYNDTNVVSGQTYTYYVTAVNAAGESPKSNEVQATTVGAVPEFSPFIWFVVILFGVAIMHRKR